MGTVVIKSTVDEFPPRLDRGRALHLLPASSSALPRRRASPAPSPATSADICATARGARASFYSSPTGFNSTGLTDTTRLQQLVSHHALLRDHPLPRVDHHSESDRTRYKHCGGHPVRHRRGLRGLCRHRRVLAALRATSSRWPRLSWLSFHVLYTAKYAPGRSMMLLTVIHVHRGGPAGDSSPGLSPSPYPTSASWAPTLG